MARRPEDVPKRYSLRTAFLLWIGLAIAAWLIIAAIVAIAYI
jgi:hypothetical protein